MKLLLLAVSGGALGAGARHLVNVGFGNWSDGGFPWATLTVNIAGCFLMGVLIETLALRFGGSLELRTFLATGILGGFTTFSAFSMDFAHLTQRGDLALGLVYVAASVFISIAAVFAGLAITRAALA
ncbi:MAG: fluoride efflux transporter CrcB [Hyphomicrobiaceae bacterium]|jgi:CrcB protein|nr:fluoride efflux transporter CrcB [Hyphomicrobiaceae bacterium]